MPGQKRLMDDVLRLNLPFPPTPFFFLSFFRWQFSLPLPIFLFGIGPLVSFVLLWFYGLFCSGFMVWFGLVWFGGLFF